MLPLSPFVGPAVFVWILYACLLVFVCVCESQLKYETTGGGALERSARLTRVTC